MVGQPPATVQVNPASEEHLFGFPDDDHDDDDMIINQVAPLPTTVAEDAAAPTASSTPTGITPGGGLIGTASTDADPQPSSGGATTNPAHEEHKERHRIRDAAKKFQEIASACPRVAATASMLLYYTDLGTDVAFVNSVWDNLDTRPYAIVSVVAVFACPVILSIADVASSTGMEWKGVLLNFTFTRMLYTTYRVVRPTKDETALSAGNANTDCKLLEALLESVPQLYIQLTVLLRGIVPAKAADGTAESAFVIGWISVGISVLSIAYATTSKYMGMVDAWGETKAVVCTFVYFLADALSRALAVALVAATMGGTTLVWCIIGWVLLDVVLHYVQAGEAGKRVAALRDVLVDGTPCADEYECRWVCGQHVCCIDDPSDPGYADDYIDVCSEICGCCDTDGEPTRNASGVIDNVYIAYHGSVNKATLGRRAFSIVMCYTPAWMLRLALYVPMRIVGMAVHSDHTPLAALVSLFTAMPLSTKPEDLQRGCIVTTAVFSITLFAVFFYGNPDPNNADTFSSSGGGSSSYGSVLLDEWQGVSGAADGTALVFGSGSGDSGIDAFQALDTLKFTYLAIALVAIKLVAYLVGLWKLQRGAGALPIEKTGFALFALDTAVDGQASALTASNLHSSFLEHFRPALSDNPTEYLMDGFNLCGIITTLPSDIDDLSNGLERWHAYLYLFLFALVDGFTAESAKVNYNTSC
eukprot:gene12709-17780_t